MTEALDESRLKEDGDISATTIATGGRGFEGKRGNGM